MSISTVKVNGNEIQLKRVNADTNGNPRYVVHYLCLGLDTYESTAKTRKAGLRIYKGKDFGGGFVFSSHSTSYDLPRILETLNS